MRIRVLLCAALLVLGGCANFKAAGEFGRQTAKMSAVVKDEFSRMQNECLAQAELVAKTAGITDDGPFDACRQYAKAQGALAAATVEVLDNYAGALSAVADDKSFDLAPDLAQLGGRVQALTDPAGNPLVSANEATAFEKLASALAEVWTASRRADAVRRLADQAPALAQTGRILKSYFVEMPDAPRGRAKAPYTNLVKIAASSVRSTESMLRNPRFQEAEPIRTYELLKEVQARAAYFRARGAVFEGGAAPPPAAERVQARIADAIDAWLDALGRFEAEATSPDPKALFDQLKSMSAKINAARAALSAP